MSKLYMTAALAATLVATAPTAYAQVSTAPHTSAAATSAAGHEIQPDQFRAAKMIGSSVYDVQNRNIGKVKDLSSIGTEGLRWWSLMSAPSWG